MNATLQRSQLPQVPGAEHVRATLTPILWSIADGSLRAGDEVRAPALAAGLRLGIAEVEDAIPRLAHLGLIQLPDEEEDEEAEPAVMTSFTPDQAIREVRGWAEVHLAMFSTAPRLRSARLRRMQRVRDAYADRVAEGAPYAALNLVFFGILYEVTPNFGFRLATTSAAYRLRLTEDVLPQDPRKTTELHDALLAALRSDDVLFAAEFGMRTWSGSLTGKPLGW